MRADDEDYILDRSVLALGPCECPTGSPYREPPSRLYRTDHAPAPCGPYITPNWFFHSLMRMCRNMLAGYGPTDSLGEPMGHPGILWDRYRRP